MHPDTENGTCCFWGVVTSPCTVLSVADINAASGLLGLGGSGVCPSLTAKGPCNRCMAIYELPATMGEFGVRARRSAAIIGIAVLAAFSAAALSHPLLFKPSALDAARDAVQADCPKVYGAQPSRMSGCKLRVVSGFPAPHSYPQMPIPSSPGKP